LKIKIGILESAQVLVMHAQNLTHYIPSVYSSTCIIIENESRKVLDANLSLYIQLRWIDEERSDTTFGADICKVRWITTPKAPSTRNRISGCGNKCCGSSMSSSLATSTTRSTSSSSPRIGGWNTIWTCGTSASSSILEAILPSVTGVIRLIKTNNYLKTMQYGSFL